MSHQREVLATRPNALFSQQEDADLDYTVNWVGRLGTNTITSSVWELENSSGLTISNESNTDTKTTARFKGSNAARRYLLTNTITLSTGEAMQYQFRLQVLRNNRGTISDYQDFSSYGNM